MLLLQCGEISWLPRMQLSSTVSPCTVLQACVKKVNPAGPGEIPQLT